MVVYSVSAAKKFLAKGKYARMDDANRALCYAMRHPGQGQKPMPYKDIQKHVRKTNGKKPSIGAISEAAQDFMEKKFKRGRKKGDRKTTKAEDKQILEAFHKMRPPGYGVDSRDVHTALPKKLKKKVGRRTVIRRLAAKGFVPEKKLSKSDPTVLQKKKRILFCKRHKDTTPAEWRSELQALGDIKEFTYYPKELQPRFKRFRAPWTYMNKKEKKQGPFLRPKRWFKKEDWKKVKKQKVFGITTSNGKVLAFLVPKPWSAEQWAVQVKKKVGPFLKKAFPGKSSFTVLLDGEKLLHAPVAKAAFREQGMTALPGWPPYSPELNPQENVWPIAEKYMRNNLESDDDTFATFQKNCLTAVKAYPSPQKLVGAMAKRVKKCLERNGGMLDQ